MVNKENDKQRVNLNIGVENLKKVDDYSAKTGLNRTAIMNLALIKFFEQEEKNK